MALDRDQVGLLFKIDVNSMDARQQLELFQGVVQGNGRGDIGATVTSG